MGGETYDVVVIGAGPGGYVAAIRAAQLGMRVACVESRGALGGTCLNVGCIPSKALLQSSHLYEEAKAEFDRHGIKVGDVNLDLETMLERKNQVVRDLTQGVAFLFRKNKVDTIEGFGVIKAPDTVEVTPSNGGKAQTLKTQSIVIATGSDIAPLPGIEIDENRIVSSTGALDLKEVPQRMVVVGGGYIGLELGSVWRRLGAEVTVVEFLDQILAGMDGEVAKQMHRLLKKQGMEFKLSRKVTGAEPTNEGVKVTIEPVKDDDGETEMLTVDVVLVSVGRRPYTSGLGLDAIGVALDDRGFIKVDHDFKTNVPGVFAIGDVIGGKMLAHKAEDEGVAVMELIAGQSGHVNYAVIPGVVYTWPEVASVGQTEEQLKADEVDYRTGKFPFTANSRARCNADSDGFVKILADAKNDRILGCHIIGPEAGDLIQEAVTAMEFGGSAEDLARTCHGHPGLAEAIKEAALGVAGRAIHI